MVLISWVVGLQLIAQALPAQTEPAPQETVAVQPDTIRPAPVPEESANAAAGAARDTARKKGTLLPTRSPMTAMLLSGFLPGGGQFYTRNYLKGVLIGGAELTLAGLTVREHLLAQKSDTAYHLDLRNTFLWWTGFAIGYSVADAYVSANMFGFKEEQRLDARIAPLRFELAYRF